MNLIDYTRLDSLDSTPHSAGHHSGTNDKCNPPKDEIQLQDLPACGIQPSNLYGHRCTRDLVTEQRGVQQTLILPASTPAASTGLERFQLHAGIG